MRHFQLLHRNSKLYLYPFIFLISVFAAVATLYAEQDSAVWADGYNSSESGLEEERFAAVERVYTRFQLENLRRAVSPRYIRVLDWSVVPENHYLKKGILLTYSGYKNKKVLVAGDFNNWTPTAMERNRQGVYFYLLPIRETELGKRSSVYHYKFLVDGMWIRDPNNKNYTDDGLGGYLSSFHLFSEDAERTATVHLIREERPSKERLVEFAIYLPRVENLSVVGNFNRWNPEHDFLKKGNDGVFRLRLRLPPGEYYYRYVADGQWTLDKFNPQTKYFSGMDDLCSYIKVE